MIFARQSTQKYENHDHLGKNSKDGFGELRNLGANRVRKENEARVGIEPTNTAFAEPCLTTWLPRRKKINPYSLGGGVTTDSFNQQLFSNREWDCEIARSMDFG